MIILVLGNGFDLAHKLPTSYSDFLEFVRMYQNDSNLSVSEENRTQLSNLVEHLNSRIDPIANEVQQILGKENKLLNYFLSVYEQRCQAGRNGWIDFEAEIADIIQTFDSACEFAYTEIARGESRYKFSSAMLEKIAPFVFARGEYQSAAFFHIPPGVLKKQAEYILSDLNELTRLLEIYLTEYIEKIEPQIRIPNIYCLGNDIDAVISFNYTDTYRRLYRGSEMVPCCFIHGKASSDSTVQSCNLVLGIDEYLDSRHRDSDNTFIWFKKFYQRIYKETHSDYIDWLNDDIEEKKNDDEPLPSYIYFYGHSLDMTDKDILEKLIMQENAIIRIFYHNKDAMAKQISNLVKIIGSENLIRMTRGRDRKIEFWPAKEAVDEAVCKMITKKRYRSV